MSESQNIEWKESWRDDYIKWICGFANAQGGSLIIGKNDSGVIVGIENAEKLAEDIPNKVKDLLGIMVDVNIHHEHEKTYIEIITEPYPYPVNYKGQYHYRSGSTKQELKGNALNKFILQKAGKHWDSIPVSNLKVSDLDTTAFEYFRQKAVKSKRVNLETLKDSNEILLEHLKLFDNGECTKATILLFHAKPEKYITGAYVKIGFFETDADLLYQDEIHGNLFNQIEKTMDLLLSKYSKALISYDGIHRVETDPYPEDALREAVTNAIAHKDYSSGIPIQISVYENKLIIWNEGQIPTDWSLEKLVSKHPSKPFNPDIANTFFRAGLIESWGRGIFKIIDACVKEGLTTPIFRTDFGGLFIEFTARNSSEKGSEKGSEKSSEKSSEKVLALIQNNETITIAELSKKIGISTRAIEKHLTRLQMLRKLERIGGDKGGYWKIIN